MTTLDSLLRRAFGPEEIRFLETKPAFTAAWSRARKDPNMVEAFERLVFQGSHIVDTDEQAPARPIFPTAAEQEVRSFTS